MATTVTDEPLNEVGWPQLSTCSTCDADILLALAVNGTGVIVLDAWPVIVGVDVCSSCKGKGRRGVPEDLARRHHKLSEESLTTCPKCRGTGQMGEPLTRQHVVMSHDGVARGWQRMSDPWDSAYRRHNCEQREVS
jgi:hypothetical protein